MAIRVAINGYGRIGRMVLRALYESGRKDIEIVAINSSGGDAESNAHLTRYDSAHGRFPFEVGVDGDFMIIGSHKIKTFATRNPILSWNVPAHLTAKQNRKCIWMPVLKKCCCLHPVVMMSMRPWYTA
jgi:glyceraldehyde-3-phosphate dehydrogenase/erythrose-4-phosphate dehydrogenase